MPYLSQNIVSMTTGAELGRAGDQVNVTNRMGNVLTVQHVSEASPPFSVTQDKVSDEPIKIDAERVEPDTLKPIRKGAKSPKRNGQSNHDKEASREQISLW